MNNHWKRCSFVTVLVLAEMLGQPLSAQRPERNQSIRHVLLISIDGMHALDFINCANGINGVNGDAPYCPNLAGLKTTGINYLQASTSKPSDSFPPHWLETWRAPSRKPFSFYLLHMLSYFQHY